MQRTIGNTQIHATLTVYGQKFLEKTLDEMANAPTVVGLTEVSTLSAIPVATLRHRVPSGKTPPASKMLGWAGADEQHTIERPPRTGASPASEKAEHVLDAGPRVLSR